MATDTKSAKPSKPTDKIDQDFQQDSPLEIKCPRFKTVINSSSKFCSECGSRIISQKKKKSDLSVTAFVLSFLPLLNSVGIILAAVDIKKK